MEFELDESQVRSWIGKLPDAGLFKDGHCLACDDDGEWRVYSHPVVCGPWGWMREGVGSSNYLYLNHEFFSMPELTGDQWKYSCISIQELAEWQQQQKD